MTLVETIKQNAKTGKWVGIFMVIAGLLAMMSPFAAGLSITLIIGALLLVGGVTQLIVVFRAGSIGQGILLALIGVLHIVAGGYMIAQPGLALAVLTLFLAGFFIAEGIVEIIGAFGARPAEGWGWLLFGGIVSVLLGISIWQQFPLSGVWAVGILVGVRLLMSGSLLISISSTVKAAVTDASGQSA